jgi:hypothetical protein
MHAARGGVEGKDSGVSPVRRRRRRGVRHTLRRPAAVLRTRPVVLALAGAAAVGMLALAWGGWTAYRVYADLKEAKDQALILEAALARGDVESAQRANQTFRDVTESAARRTDGVAWGVFESVPVLGDDAEGLAMVADVLSEVGEQGIPPLLESAAALTAGSYAPADHQFPLDRIAALEEPAARSSAVFAEAADRLDRLGSGGFVSPLRREVDALADEVDRPPGRSGPRNGHRG